MEPKSKDMDDTDEKRINRLLNRKADDDIDNGDLEKVLQKMEEYEDKQKRAAKQLWKKTLDPKLEEVFS